MISRRSTAGDCLIRIIPLQATLASSLFRPRRNTLGCSAGFFVPLQDGEPRRLLAVPDSPWRLDGAAADFLPLDGKLTLEQPAEGVALARGGSVLGVCPAVDGAAFPLLDAYVRGIDLVARYGPCEAFPFRTEVYWRAAEAGLQLIVSVETDLLDTHPVIGVRSVMPADRAGSSAPTDGLLVCPLESGRAWCEAVHPSDRQEADLVIHAAEEGAVAWEWTLFARFLEKGVIRRARLAGATLPDGRRETASRWLDDLATQPIPLTA